MRTKKHLIDYFQLFGDSKKCQLPKDFKQTNLEEDTYKKLAEITDTTEQQQMTHYFINPKKAITILEAENEETKEQKIEKATKKVDETKKKADSTTKTLKDAISKHTKSSSDNNKKALVAATKAEKKAAGAHKKAVKELEGLLE